MKSITQLPKEEAYKMAKALSSNNEGTAFGRFSDFENYYPKRIKTEKWLYNSFIEAGGNPQVKNPYYFVLHHSTYLSEWFDNALITSILLKDIADEDISFTIGDSMSKATTEIITKDDLVTMMNDFTTIDQFLESLDVHYIEAQLWNNQYFTS